MEEKQIIDMLDNLMNSGVSRLKVEMNESLEDGSYTKKSHHGRCDVGSPFATGKLYDFEDGCE